MLSRHGHLTGSPVLRMEEFQKELFLRLNSLNRPLLIPYQSQNNQRPENPPQKTPQGNGRSLNILWRLAPLSFVQALFADFASSHREEFAQNSRRSHSFFLYFYQFLHLLLHPEGEDLMEEWRRARKIKRRSLGLRFWDLSREFFSVLREKHLLPEKGLSGFLIHQIPALSPSALPFQKLIFDLGAVPEPADQEFLKELSQKAAVEWIVPHFTETKLLKAPDGPPSFRDEGAQSAEFFDSKAEGVQSGASTPGKDRESGLPPRIFQIRKETRLREIQEAARRARQWKSQGVSENDIALLAPDIEEYWPCLKYHLKKAGLSFKKGTRVPLIDKEEILCWLSKISLHAGILTFPDMETAEFYGSPKRRFPEFSAQFASAPEGRFSKRLLKRQRVKNKKERLSGREFVRWVASFWPAEADPYLFPAALEGFKTFPLEEELTIDAWLEALRTDLFSPRKESEEALKGVSCLSLNALHSVRENYIFLMGLDQDSLSPLLSNLGARDVEQPFLDFLGFPLSFPHQRSQEWNLLWLLQSDSLKELCFSFSERDFLDSAAGPSLLWQSCQELFPGKAQQPDSKDPAAKPALKKETSTSTFTEAASPQRESVLAPPAAASEKKEAGSHATELLRRESSPQMAGETEAPSVRKKSAAGGETGATLRNPHRNHFSPSSLKAFKDCPFAYAVKYVFNFSRPTDINREFSPLSFGSLTHKLLEKLFEREDFITWEEEEIDSLIEDLKPRETDFVHSGQWTVIRKPLKKIAIQLMERESALFQRFPDLRVCGRELEVDCFYSFEKQDFATEGDILFKGRIDRLDYEPNAQSFLIRDYKSSLSSLNHIDTWIKKGELSALLLYALIIEKGLVAGLPEGKARVLDYYSYKDFSHKGYVEKGSPFEGIFGPKWRGKKARAVLESAFQYIKEEVPKVLRDIEEGRFPAKPSDEKHCERCFCRKWCRAPHLY